MPNKQKVAVKQVVKNSNNVVQVAGNYVVNTTEVKNIFNSASKFPFRLVWVVVWLVLSFVYSSMFIAWADSAGENILEGFENPVSAYFMLSLGIFCAQLVYGAMGYLVDLLSNDNTQHSVLYWYLYPVFSVIRLILLMTKWTLMIMFFIVGMGRW